MKIKFNIDNHNLMDYSNKNNLQENFNASTKECLKSYDDYFSGRITKDKYYAFLTFLKNYLKLNEQYKEINQKIGFNNKNYQTISNFEKKLLTLYEKDIKQLAVDSIKNIHEKTMIKKHTIILSHIVSAISNINNNAMNKSIKSCFDKQLKYLQYNINNQVFNNKINNFNQFIGFLDNTEKTYIPHMISLFMCTNINNIDNDLHISPSIVFNRKNGDCTEYMFMADFLLKRYGFDTLVLGMTYKQKNIGHGICLFKGARDKWDFIDTNGYWNANWDEPLSSTREMFKDVKEMYRYDVDYTPAGKFVSEAKETKIYP